MTTVSLLILSLAAADPGASRGELLDFTASWCGPCQQMSPVVSRLQRQGYPVRKVDIEREPELAKKYNVKSIPAFVLVVDGQEQNRIVGMTSEGQLRRMLSQIPNDPRYVAEASPPKPRKTVQVAENTASPKTGSRRLGFVFPFGGKSTPPTESDAADAAPPVIRAKLDEEKPTPPPVSTADDPLASSVRVRITSKTGMNYGSGTIIQSLPGRTVILTCGHIFRNLADDAKIEVDLFRGTEVESLMGQTIGYDLDGDVGLLSITTDGALPVSRIAGGSQVVQVRQSLYSIGCGGGEPPSREDLHVTALNRYLGPDNVECTGVPLQGRSGGGLFAATGEVVGVCVAADPLDKRGLYAGLKVIHQLLKAHQLSELCPEPLLEETPTIAAAEHSNPAPGSVTPPAPVASPVTAAVAKGSELPLAAGLDFAEEAEVVCIVRLLNQPKAASQVVIINRASSRFVSYLTQEMRSQPQPTMHQVPLVEAEAAPEPPPFFTETFPEPPPFAQTMTTTTTAARLVAAPVMERYRRHR